LNYRLVYAYDRKSHFGRLDVALDIALINRCTVIDMKTGWKMIFPFDRLEGSNDLRPATLDHGPIARDDLAP
jgi:hypothetical protein